MDIDFRDAGNPEKESDFAMARTIHRKMGFEDPFFAFAATLRLVTPDMAQLGTENSLGMILKALSADARNIDLDVVITPGKPEKTPLLSRLAFSPFGSSNAAGTLSREELLKALSRLARLGEEDSGHLTRRATARRDDIFNAAGNGDETRNIAERTEQGLAFKRNMRFLLVRELQRLLYDDRGPIDIKLQNATHELRERLIDGDRVQRAVYEVIDDFGSVGELMREKESRTVVQAVAIRKARQELWAGTLPKHKQI